MAMLSSFETPAQLRDLPEVDRQRWSSDVLAFHTGFFAAQFPQYYDPTVADTPDDIRRTDIVWSAFPARLSSLPPATRWALADSTRDEHDEYCEWLVDRNGDGRVTAITFTTEVPEYWSHIAESDTDKLLELYRALVSPSVTLDDLLDDNGHYLRNNRWNGAQTSGIVHLRQQSNTLQAALRLVAESTILRQRPDGTLITDRQELVRCGQLGEPRRNSDPQIAEIVNDAAATGASVTLADPLGLYLDGLQSAGMQTPDLADAVEFWTVERGTNDAAVRTKFEVPADRGYTVGDITIAGTPIEFGAQVAEKVRVRVSAFAKPDSHAPVPRPCAE